MMKIVFTLPVLVTFLLVFSAPSAAQQPLAIPKPSPADMKYVQEYAEQRDMQTRLFLQLDEKMYPQARAIAEQKKQAAVIQKQNWLQNVMNPATWFKKPEQQPPAPVPLPTAQPATALPTPQATAPAPKQATDSAPSFIVLPPKEEPATANKQAAPEQDAGPQPVFGFTR